MNTNAEPNTQPPAAPAAAPETVVAQPATVAAPAAEQQQQQPAAAKPEVEQQQAEGQQPSAEPFSLAVPGFVPLGEQTPEREAMLSEFSQIAPTVGLDAGVAQGILDMAVDAASVLDYQGADEYTNADDAFTAMTHVFGEEEAKNLVSRAQKYAASLGPKFQEYLDRTNLGNDVATLTSLALAAGLKQSREQAQASIEKLMGSEKYAKGDKLTTIVLHALSRIANREPAPARNPLAPSRTPSPAQQQASRAAAEKQQADARAEAAKLISDPSGALMNASHPEHAAALTKWNALVAKL
jgi:hypothetical protein